MFRSTHRIRLMGVAAIAAAGLALAGCAASSTSSPSENGKTTLTFWGWTDMTGPVTQWNKENPNIQVKFQAITSNFYPKLQAAIRAKSGAPDITQVDYPNLTSTVIAGDLKALTDDESKALKSEFDPAVWDQVNIDGKSWGVPQDIGTQVLYYRSDLFAAAGIPAPKTWDEYLTDAQTLKQANPDSYMTAFPTNGGAWFAALAWQNQASWFTAKKDSWDVAIDDKASTTVAAYWQQLLDQGLVKGDQHWQPTWFKGLADGTYLTWIGPAWGAASLVSNAPDLAGKWAVAPLPQWSADEDAPVYWGGSLTALTSATTKDAAALKFIKWMNTSTTSAEVLAQTAFPASTNGQNLPALSQPNPYFGGQDLSKVFQVTDAKSIPWVWGPTMTDTTNYLNDAMQSVVNKETTLPDALKTVEDQTVAQLKEKGISVK